MASIVAIGIALADVYPQQSKLYPGGNEYNICCYARELGASASFMGVFTPDATGRLLQDVLLKRGVDISHSRHAEGYSNMALVELQNNNRTFTGWTRAAVTDKNPIRFCEEDFRFIKTHDIACGSYASRLQAADFKQLHDAGIPLCYDFSDSFTGDIIETMCPNLRFAFFSCDHLEEAACAKLLEKAVALGCEVAVGTRGKQGSMAYDGQAHFTQAAIEAPVVDTMGAGDSFITAFLCHWFGAGTAQSRQARMPAAMRAAAAFATRVIQRQGALGISYDVDAPRLADIVNTIKEERA